MLVAAGYFFAALLHGLKWFMFHNADRAIDAVTSLTFAIVLIYWHREYMRNRQYLEEMKKVKDEHPFPWEIDSTPNKQHG